MPRYSPTPSELAVLEALCSGRESTNKAIAARLGISPHTVSNRIRDMRRSTGATSRTALAVWWQAARAMEKAA